MESSDCPTIIKSSTVNNCRQGRQGPQGPPGKARNRIIPYASSNAFSLTFNNIAGTLTMRLIADGAVSNSASFAIPFTMGSAAFSQNFAFCYADPAQGNINALSATYTFTATNVVLLPTDTITITFHILQATGTSNIFQSTTAMASVVIPGPGALDPPLALSVHVVASSTFAPVPVNFTDRLILVIYAETTSATVSFINGTASAGISIQ